MYLTWGDASPLPPTRAPPHRWDYAFFSRLEYPLYTAGLWSWRRCSAHGTGAALRWGKCSWYLRTWWWPAVLVVGVCGGVCTVPAPCSIYICIYICMFVRVCVCLCFYTPIRACVYIFYDLWTKLAPRKLFCVLFRTTTDHIQYCTVQHSTVQYSTVLYCTVLCCTVQYSIVAPFTVMWCV